MLLIVSLDVSIQAPLFLFMAWKDMKQKNVEYSYIDYKIANKVEIIEVEQNKVFETYIIIF